MNVFINEFSKNYEQHMEYIIKILGDKYSFNTQEAINYVNNYNKPIDCRNDDVYIKVEPPDFNVSITNSHEEKKKRGRPKKPVDPSEEKPKKKRGRPKKENKVTIVQDSDDEIEIKKEPEESIEDKINKSIVITDVYDITDDLELEEEEYDDVEEWDYKGDKYFKDKNQNIYNLETREKIGIYNSTQDMINSIN